MYRQEAFEGQKSYCFVGGIEQLKEGGGVNPRKELEKVTPYRPPVSRRGKIRMDLNESPRGCSPRVMDALKNLTIDDVSRYPEYDTLIKKIANHHQVGPDNVLLTNGADEAIRCVIDAYLDKNDTLIVPDPTFPMFEILAKARGVTVVKVLYNEDLSFPVKKYLELADEPFKMMVIVNPGSPTGTSIKREDLLEIVKKARDSLVLVDEAYSDFAGVTCADLIHTFSNVVVIRTFSKAFGLAGLRLGYAVADKSIIETMYKVRLPFPVNTITVIAGLAALEDMKYTEKVVEQVKEEKEFLKEELEKWGIRSFMTDTNFLLVHLGDECSRVQKSLQERGILVKSLEGRPLLTGWLRVTMSTHKENMMFLEALKEMVLPEAILFDMDGVLVDERESYLLATKKTAEYFLDECISLEEIESYNAESGYNNEWDVTEAIIASRKVRIPREKIVRKFQQIFLGDNYDGFILNEKWLADTSLLEKLGTSHKLGIITGRVKEEVLHTLNRFGVADFFDVVITTDDVKGRLKPDPYGINLALQQLDVKRAVYIGDNIDDIRAARAAGIAFIGVASTCELEKSFANMGVTRIVKTVNQVQDILSYK